MGLNPGTTDQWDGQRRGCGAPAEALPELGGLGEGDAELLREPHGLPAVWRGGWGGWWGWDQRSYDRL